MSELTTEQIIKIILGALVFVAVVIGVYFFFRFHVIDFFRGYTDEENIEGKIPVVETEEVLVKEYPVFTFVEYYWTQGNNVRYGFDEKNKWQWSLGVMSRSIGEGIQGIVWYSLELAKT